MAGKRLITRTALALAKLLGFVLVSCLCGVLAASLVVPGVAARRHLGQQVDHLLQQPALRAGGVRPVADHQSADRGREADRHVLRGEPGEGAGWTRCPRTSRTAIVAIEDSRFYEHAGVDPQGILRALTSNLTSGGRQGASTLTQQYVTNVLNESLIVRRTGRIRWSSAGRRAIGDKVREMKLAIELEKKYTKDQILEGYLNIVFFNRRRLRHRGRGPAFLQHHRQGPHPAPGRPAGRPGQQPQLLRSRRPSGELHQAAQPGPGQDAQPGQDHPG